ncbi:MAG: amidohydrolase [Caldilineaceae bacterium]|nr:amidohydrolase [Caldilineaceae bacterium]
MQADLVLYNGNIHTMDRQRPRASAVAIAGDRFLAAGGDDEMRALLARGDREVDLRGATVVPGFIDAHIHFLSYGLSLQEIDLSGVATLASALERVRQRAAQTPAGQWLTGRGWDQSVWEGGAFPTAAQLDAVAPQHPVFLARKCGHAAWVNSRALALMGISAATTDPDGGEIVRDGGGQPSGILLERAMGPAYCLLTEPSPQAAVAAVREAQKVVNRMGIVGVHTKEAAASLRAIQQLRADGDLTLRTVAQIPVDELDSAIRLGLRTGLGDEFLCIGGVKVFSDGALGPRTAWMLAPYEGEPDNLGIAVTGAEEMADIVARATEAGLAVVTHAIGDRANRMVLDALAESRRAGHGVHLRHRIEHAQLLHPDDVDRFAQLDIIASVQPIHATQDMRIADRYWGARSRYAYAFRSLWDSGARLAFGSDAPVETPDVIQGIHAAVTRMRADGSPGGDGWYPAERLTVSEAVWAYTMGAAYAGGSEESQGSITPGKLADLVVLSQDIFTVHPMAILETEVEATLFGGAFVWGEYGR